MRTQRADGNWVGYLSRTLLLDTLKISANGGFFRSAWALGLEASFCSEYDVI